ncbi:MAG: pyridoxal phosphate-dependent aminotransferase [Elusimicrobia bacterium]|nr:pyridoxal phosphate-dependent aminotransferase [Elusimicrobiota bacterium]MBU2614606.1 pyridoxal phosphate-dependent aminotransferase [Elusimicrobiota bacterium]
MVLAKRMNLISPSPTLAITAKANKMKAEGINVIGFGAGEPDFDTPANIKEAAKKAIDSGFTKYTPTSGTKELKEAVCKKFKNDNNLDYTPEQILVSCGAKHSIFNIIFALCDDGDEAIIPSPYWVSYPEMVRAAGGRPVFIKTTQNNNFKITPEQLEKAITSKTKILILNSPSNPTGMIYSEPELKALAKVIVSKNIYCISDEIYEKLVYDNQKHISIAAFDENIRRLTLVVNGVSKSHSMTGWRIGYCAGPKEIIQAMSNLQDHSTSNPASISQAAAVEALTGPADSFKIMFDAFVKRRNIMVTGLNSIKGIKCLKPQGAFYVFPDISELLKKNYNGKTIGNSLALTELLLENAKVAVIPGSVFGEDNAIRLSYAVSDKNISEGLDRIKKFANAVR